MKSSCKAQHMGKEEKDLKRLGYRSRRPKFPGSSPHEKKWVKLDSNGKTAVVGVDRQRLTQQLGIQLRDLRILDPKFNTSYPSAILCRENALVVNLEHIKAIISPLYVFVMNPETDGVVEFIKDLEERLSSNTTIKRSISCPSLEDVGRNNASEDKKKNCWISGSTVSLKGWAEGEEEASVSCKAMFQTTDTPLVGPPPSNGIVQSAWEQELPFELTALEVCLESICRTLDESTTDLEATAFPALDALTLKVNTENLQRVRSIKSKMVRLKTRVETIREVLEKFLDDDSDMKSMNLTAKLQSQVVGGGVSLQSNKPPPPSTSSSSDSDDEDEDLQEVEMLLEAYFMQLDNTLNRLHTLCNYTDDTEDYVNIQQDKHRNQLLQLELLITAGTFALSFISVISGIFGMNLTNDSENSKSAFVLVTTLSASGAVCVFIALLLFSRFTGLMFQ